jgi:conjugative relaxase-like TrwC/TraI family protein
MLRASPPLTAGQASHYYRSEFSRGDYYTERESEGIVHSRWHGRGAEQLDLIGRVRADDFSHLLDGHDPGGEHVLVPHREGLSERRAGWDVTISPHKSVSLAALVGGDKRLLEAHDRAVAKALSELERHAQAWVHGGRDVETTGLTVAASFRHETSRALDPQLHSHCVILNVTRRVDGEWRAVNARGIFRAQRLAREIYEAELAKELRSLGYEVKTYRDCRTGRDRAVGITGFEPEHLKVFSKRSRDIEKALQSQGLRSRLHGSRVTVATRKAKEKGIDREALLWNWRSAARDARIQFPKWEKERLVSPGRLSPARELELATRLAVNGARDHLSERRAVFGLSELEREALVRGRERGVTIDDVRKDVFGRDDLVVADRSDAVRARVTTERAIDEERALLGRSIVAAVVAQLCHHPGLRVAWARINCGSRGMSSPLLIGSSPSRARRERARPGRCPTYASVPRRRDGRCAVSRPRRRPRSS